MKSSDNVICLCYSVGFQLSLEWGTGKTNQSVYQPNSIAATFARQEVKVVKISSSTKPVCISCNLVRSF